MSIFNEFFKKEKPLFTGLKFGFGSGGSGSGSASTLASGGNIDAAPANDYFYHVFTSPGTLTVPGSKTFDVLLVAGGGSGGSTDTSNGAGGGGAGGIVHHSQLSVSGPLTITVGGGGDHDDQANQRGVNGSDSTIVYPGGPWTLTAKGGGGGGQFGEIGKDGGSGGGGGGFGGNYTNVHASATQGTPSSGQNSPFHGATGFNQYGNNGGAPSDNNPGNASGGGGAGTVGGSSPEAEGAPAGVSGGGDGRAFPAYPGPLPAFSPMPSAWKTAVGPEGLFGGGGAGENPYGASQSTAAGGPGGGGSGASPDGVTYTGGGGAGRNAGPDAGDGGDGICIIRYQ